MSDHPYETRGPDNVCIHCGQIGSYAHTPGGQAQLRAAALSSQPAPDAGLREAAIGVIEEWDSSGDGFHHAIRTLRAALSSPETTPAGVLDEAALAAAMTVVYEQDLFPIKSGDWRYDASLIAREYAAALGRSGSGGGRG